VHDVATVLIGAGSGIPIAQAFNAQIDGLLAGLQAYGHDGPLRRVTIAARRPQVPQPAAAASYAKPRRPGALRVVDDTPPVRRAGRNQCASAARSG
jgi:hypothetical protein